MPYEEVISTEAKSITGLLSVGRAARLDQLERIEARRS